MVREVVKAIPQALAANRFKVATEGIRVPQFMIGLRGRLFTLVGRRISQQSECALDGRWLRSALCY